MVDLDYGIDSLELSMTDVNDKKSRVISDTSLDNPFYVDLDGGSVKSMDYKDIYTYDKIIVLCLKNDIPDIDLNPMLNEYIEKNKYNEFGRYLTCIIGDKKMLKNKDHKDQAVIVEKSLLEQFNHNLIKLNDHEIVICLFELKENDAKTYIGLYEDGYDVDELVKSKIMFKYYNCSTYRYPIQRKIVKMVSSLKDSEYWISKYNCNINMTKAFNNYQFRTKHEDRKTMEKVDNYFDVMNKEYESKVFSKYSVSKEDDKFTKQQITELFDMTSDNKELYDMFNAFLLSKKYCHLVLNNKDILVKMAPIIEKYKPIYKYIFGYAWLCMYMEEHIVKTLSNINRRYVFDIDTASKLPFFPFCPEDIHMNPYCSVIVNSKAINSKFNCHSLAMISDYKDYGINTLDEFKNRFNIFTTGRVDMNIFEGLETKEGSDEWKSFAISGSLLPACVQKRSPLTDTLSPAGTPMLERWTRFYNEYYIDSDIDIMCNKKSKFDFIDEVNKLVQVVDKNIKLINGKENSSINIEPKKSMYVNINPLYIKKCMTEYDYDYVVKHLKDDEIKDNFYAKYITNKVNNNKALKNKFKDTENSLLSHYFKFATQDEMRVVISEKNIYYDKEKSEEAIYSVYLNDILGKDEQVPDEENVRLLIIDESIKFKIHSPYLLHSIEVFKIKFEDFFSCVSHFHLSCVRGFYNGNNVHLLPSCVTAMMTGLNIDYKYFASLIDPTDIINKYRMRGFGTIINNASRNDLVKFNKDSKWTPMYSPDRTEKSLGCKHLASKIFRPGQYLNGFPEDMYLRLGKRYVFSVNDLYECYNLYKNDGLDILSYKTIKSDGTIEPVRKWLIDAAYELLS